MNGTSMCIPGQKLKNCFFWDKGRSEKSLVYSVIAAGSTEAGVFVAGIDHSLKAFGKKDKKMSVALTGAEEQSLAAS